MNMTKLENSSFRDPSGFLFYSGTKLLRQINKSYQDDYDLLFSSDLYSSLTSKKLLICHQEVLDYNVKDKRAYKIIEPEIIAFISYPYEWSFNQLKDAALLTLRIQKIALKHGMSLKDATAYNVQFHNGRPIFIDTLSFEKYEENKPWVAYKQFCQHFLAPLALMSKTDIRLNQLLKIYIDGIPLDLASKILPAKTKLNFSLLMHIHMHSIAQKKYEKKGTASKKTEISKKNLESIIISLKSVVSKLKKNKQDTEWAEYYTFTNYSDKAFLNKKEIITNFVKSVKPKTVWDLGANTGEFTQIGCDYGAKCVAYDIDPLAVDANYLRVKEKKSTNLLPLVLDLLNPTPDIGWNNEERKSVKNRPHPDLIFALAIIHHIALSNNTPLSKIAKCFSELSENLIIEFVPKTDSKVKILLESREDIFSRYNENDFITDFEEYYKIIDRKNVIDSERTLFLMKRKN